MASILRKMCLTLGLLLVVYAATPSTPVAIYAQEEVPAYAKWGRLAVKEVEAKYPQARIIDYLHVGSDTQESSTIERFKLWLKEGDREFGVFVTIEFTTESEEVIQVEFEETSR